MKLLSNFRSFLLEDNFSINIYKNKIDIINYTSIGQIENDKIVIRYDTGSLIIKGEKLVVSKLLNDEILITGIIKNIEFN